MASQSPSTSEQIKWRLDLWLHQNTLMWSRIQWLYWIQVPAMGAIFAARDNKCLQVAIAVIAILLTIMVMILIDQDTHTRDRQRKILNDDLGFDFFNHKKGEKKFEEGSGSWKAIVVCLILLLADIVLLFVV